MARRIAEHDWASNPLGPIAGWPQSLKTTLSIILSSRFPMYLVWGPQLIGFPNDAYLPVLGKKEALGLPFQQTWAEIWPQIGPLAKRALEGESSFFENLPIDIERFGYPERTYFTFSYSPIREESGAVGGMLVTCIETTAHVAADQRRRFQLELSDGLRRLATPSEVTTWTCKVLGEFFTARRVGYATVESGWLHIPLPAWHDQSVVSFGGEKFALENLGRDLIARLQEGTTVRLDDVSTDPLSAGHTSLYQLLSVNAMLIVPIIKKNQLIAVLAIGTAEPRRWTDHEVALAEDAAERTRAAVERAIAEQALTRQLEIQRDRLRMLFEEAPTFMAVLRGPDHVFELVNAAYRRLVGPREFIGKPVRDVIPEAVGQGYIGMLDQVYASGTAHVVAGAFLLLKGQAGEPDVLRYLDFVYQPLLEAEGSVPGIFVVGSDVTENKLAAEALLDADRRKDEFLAMLAHELRNPLAPISTAAQLLTLTAGDKERVLEVGTIISRQVGHMTSLVDDLLDVSRVTRGLVTLEQEGLDVQSVLAHALEQARPFVESRRHLLTVRTTEARVSVRGDRTRLVQVIVNLLNNAAKYTPDGGEITLEMQTDQGYAIVTVTDTGNGIDASLLPHVFELFTQGKRTPDRAHGGLGLGLALVKSMVELHGGRVMACSGGVDQGSTFTVRLPLEHGPTRQECSPPPDAAELAKPRRIMVVDDNIDAAETLAALLDAYGHEVTVLTDTGAAINAAALDRFDIFILDIGLPGMDGYELARQLQARPDHAGALFIALTGYGQPGDRVRSKDAGFAHHFVKPADPQSLIEALAAVPVSRK